MGTENEYDSFRTTVQPALACKIDEFSLLGYDTISENELWEFLKVKKWRKAKEEIKVYEIVSDIMSVKVGDYMNYVSVKAMKNSEFSLDLNSEELKDLLK